VLHASDEALRAALDGAERCCVRGLCSGPAFDGGVALRAATPGDADAVAEI
jgi:hypothetical protein